MPDGNGRIGRQLITLFLRNQKILTKPILYISYYLKLNRVEYYDRLTEVRRKDNYEQWIRFFIRAIQQTAADSIETINLLASLRAQNRAVIEKVGRSAENVRKIFDYIEKSPIIDIRKTSDELGLAYNTVSRAVVKLCELKILNKTETVRRGRCFAYENYLRILRKNTGLEE